MKQVNLSPRSFLSNPGRRSKLRVLSSTLLFCALLLGTWCITPTATAQTWQYVYGHGLTVQEGRRGVIPVQGCNNSNGYISVGFADQYPYSTDIDIYVVRTDNFGIPLWEYRYDINGASQDKGESIIELSDGSGFVVVGHTTTSNNTDVVLMKIDCTGSIVWTRTYDIGADEVGYEVIETLTGDGSTTFPGDFVIAGEREASGAFGPADAFLIRTTGNGVLIWDQLYNEGYHEKFWSLTEATPYGQSTGDIIGAGAINLIVPNITEGYAVRVDGNDGQIYPGTLQGSSRYTIAGTGDEEIYSIIELQNPNELGSLGAPNVVMAGYTSYNQGSDLDMYFVKLDNGNPCTPILQTTGGNVGPNFEDVARCIREIPFVPDIAADFSQWDLVVTGYMNDDGNFNRNMIIQTLNPGTLQQSFPVGIGNSYGNTDDDEDGWSIFPVEETGGRTEGFILCGYTYSDWHGYNDPGDMYLVKTNNQGVSTSVCEHPYAPHFEDREVENTCMNPLYAPAFSPIPPSDSKDDVDWDDELCTGPGNGAKLVVLNDDRSNTTMATQPNPVQSGASVILQINSVNIEKEISLNVVNALGKNMAVEIEQITPIQGEIVLSTENWPTGVYHIAVQNGEKRWSTQIIVLE